MNNTAPMRAAPVPLAPVPVRLAVPPLPGQECVLPAPVVVRLAVPPLARGPLPRPAQPMQAAPQPAPEPVAARSAWVRHAWVRWPDVESLGSPAATWAREHGALTSALLGLGLVLLLGWFTPPPVPPDVVLWGRGGGLVAAGWLNVSATLGGLAWGWYWWRGRPLATRGLAICGGLVLFPSGLIATQGIFSGLGLSYSLSWWGLMLFALWKGGGALLRRFAPGLSARLARPASGDAPAPSLLDRALSQRVQVEGGGASGVQRIRIVSTSERLKIIYWSARLVWLVTSLTIIAFFHDDILHYVGRLLARNSGRVAGGAFQEMLEWLGWK